MKMASTTRTSSGFTLVEVVLAIGLLSFVAIVILGLFSQLYRSGDYINEMRAAVGASNSLRSYLQEEMTFTKVYDWAKLGSVELVYASFLANEAEDPEANPEMQVLGKWYSSWASEKAAVEGAQQGRWLKAILKPHPTLNPVTPLPVLALYSHTYIVFEVDFHVVPDPDFAPTGRPILTTAVAVQRK